jgi:hypothetical protein
MNDLDPWFASYLNFARDHARVAAFYQRLRRLVEPTGPRMTTDREALVVVLDGHRYPVNNPRTFKLWEALVESHNRGEPTIARRVLWARAGQRNKDPRVEELRQGVDARIAGLLRSRPGRTGGIYLALPPVDSPLIPGVNGLSLPDGW